MKIGIVGSSGLVGKTLKTLVTNHPLFKNASLVSFTKKPTFENERLLSVKNFSDIQFVLFATPSDVSQEWIPKIIANSDAYCIDGSCAFRQDKDVPLIIPEINGKVLKAHHRIIASPNCTTTIALMAIWPLDQAFQLKSFIVNSYQAASGMGNPGLAEFEQQLQDYYQKKPQTDSKVFPKPLAFNVIPQVGNFIDQHTTDEEEKIATETKKILQKNKLAIFANCVRVPVQRCHSIAINAQFEKPINWSQIPQIYQQYPQVQFFSSGYPCPREYEMKNICAVGRVRPDPTQPNALALWTVGDQLLKGAALNMIQILELINRLKIDNK